MLRSEETMNVPVEEGAMALCRVCLVGNIRLLNLSNIYLAAYQKLTDNEVGRYVKLEQETTELVASLARVKATLPMISVGIILIYDRHNLKTECDMPSTVCYVCHRQLQRLHMFSEMARKSNRILQDLLCNGTKVTHNALIVQPLNVVLNLNMTSTVHWSLGDTETTSSTPVAVKDEPKIENNDEETLECEAYNMEESKLESLEDIHFNDGFNKTVLERDNNTNADMNNMHSCFNCDLCNRFFYKKGDMVKHLKFHTKAKRYSCNRCDKAFTIKSHLDRHLRIHTGEKPYSCNRCTKAFIAKSYLDRHLRIHTGEKPYSCNRCDKTFVRKHHLTRHVIIHTGEKPYSCTRCDKTFALKQHMTRHMKIHTSEQPNSCNRSDTMSFTQKYNLKYEGMGYHCLQSIFGSN